MMPQYGGRCSSMCAAWLTPTTQKLLSKTQVGHRYRKVFEREAKTPAQRVLEDPTVPSRRKARVRKLLAQNDPLRLIREISNAKDAMWKAIADGQKHLQPASTTGLRLGKGFRLR